MNMRPSPPPPRTRTLADLWLRLAAPLVPHDLRRDWLREWRAELAHMSRQAARAGRSADALCAWRAAGALPHAVWLRWDRWRIEMIWQDLKHAVRTLRSKPAFTAVTLATLALGIGGNAAIFGVVHAVLLRPLPFPEPERLVQVFKTTVQQPDRIGGSATPPDFTDWRRDNQVFTELSAHVEGSYALTGTGGAEQVPGAEVTGGFFPLLGTPAYAGRTITTGDDPAGARDVVVLSHGLWTRRFGADPALIGQTLQIDGVTREVVGVMPAGFQYPLQSELWIPLRFTERDLTTQRGAHYLDVLGRLRPGVSVEAARGDLRQIAATLAAAYPSTNRDSTASVIPLRDAVVRDTRQALFVLLGAVGLVLLIVCVNVAHLILIRAVGRQKEMAVRVALGASRSGLVRGLLVESLVLGAGGAVGGLILAYWSTAAIASLDAGLGVPLLSQTRLDATVVAFTFGISLAASVLFGTVPAWQATAISDFAARIRQAGGSTTSDPRRQRLRSGLIVAETMLAVVLLVGAGLLARSFDRLRSVDMGFATDSIQTFTINLPDTRYAQPAQRAAFVNTLLTRLAARPDVQAAGAIFGLPLSNFRYTISTSTIDGRTLADEEQTRLSLQVRVVTPDFFTAMTIPLTRGRAFSAADARGAEPVVILSESAADRIWPDGDPIGRHLELGTSLGQGLRAGGAVVGIAADVHGLGPSVPARPTIYLAHAQFPVSMVSVVLRTRGEPAAVIAPAASALRDLDPDVPMFRVRSMTQLVAAAVAQPRLYTVLIVCFATTAMLLAAIGLYGVLSFAVGQRTREIGIRLALGAGRGQVLRMVMAQAGRLALTGIFAGLLAAAAASRALRAQLFEVAPTDLTTYAVVSVALLAVALLASSLPAIRAARVDPIRAIRHE